MVDATGTINSVAGNGQAGFSGDDGIATSAELNAPLAIAVDTSKNLYIADTQNMRVRKVSESGEIVTIAGTGTAGYSGDKGPALSASLSSPSGVAVDASGNVYIADTGNGVIRKIDASGEITTVAGNGTVGYSGDKGPATSAELTAAGVAVDSLGNLYIVDSNRIRKVDPSGTITTIAGTGVAGFTGDGGTATSAKLSSPTAVATDSSGNIYIADAGNYRVRRIDTSGKISTVAGNGKADFNNDNIPATSAGISVAGVAVDDSGIYIADANRIRKVDATGTITTIAGNGSSGDDGDGGTATSAEISSPVALAITP
jgi:sugar lactone lactonase YvrE